MNTLNGGKKLYEEQKENKENKETITKVYNNQQEEEKKTNKDTWPENLYKIMYDKCSSIETDSYYYKSTNQPDEIQSN